ncbi:carboxypeptidase-like regulatory domain-containing protein [Adhaeribacter sp. BT258]|uniref:Carboxypeptidase-like regulatory domain-containing protein n=1 Tax=Adhaeribacter terrigena TaxID=2793070 RepID=A0ABS1C1E4_9BACT|nr:carboxypeptidase-like regulatory domain-containing protein [Adhaeribacter terrigena]MBK0402365.1 carboxypeptidase-like regulatory domain-containing protein [Adhaeribacter terrigena]
MKKLFPTFLVALFYSLSLQAQTLQGRILDAQTKQPVEFASIGILHRDAGTVANEHGNFVLNTEKARSGDTLKVSMLGYESRLFSVPDFESKLTQGNGTILLQPQTRNLQEVVIKPRKTKTITAGNTTDSKFMSAGFTSNDLGSEVGTVLRYNKKKPGKVENVNFNIANNSYNNVFFRVNMYAFKDGKIGENLLKEPLYTDFSGDFGTLTLDLSDKNIYIDSDCLLTLEWIKDYGQRGLYFSAGFFNSDSYGRKTSHGNWFEVPAGLGFWATVVHEK